MVCCLPRRDVEAGEDVVREVDGPSLALFLVPWESVLSPPPQAVRVMLIHAQVSDALLADASVSAISRG